MDSAKILRVFLFPGAYLTDVFSETVLPEYEILVDDKDPDIIILGTGRNIRLHHWNIFRQVLQARMRFGNRPLLCGNHCEALPWPMSRDLDWLFSFQPTCAGNCLRIPVDEWKQMERARSACASPEEKEWLTRPKTRFCNFIYSAERYSSVKVREHFCRLLMNYKRVDCPGKTLNNMPRIAPRSSVRETGEILLDHRGKPSEDAPARRRQIQAKLDFTASCKFTIAFENVSTDCYLTEKIFHPLSVGSIPIYWGCRRIAEYINPDCFVNCHEYQTFAEVVHRVREIDQNPQLYEKYRSAAPVLPDSRMHCVLKGMRREAAQMAEEALRRRHTENRRPGPLQLSMLAARNADCVKDILRIPRKSRWGAVRNLISLYREILFSRVRGS